MSAGAPSPSRPRGDLVFVGDVHLDRDDPALAAFLAFLDRLSGACSRLVLMGDLFNLWLGRKELEQPHQTAVLDRLGRLRRSGVVVRYLEGNRDYRIAACYAGGPLDDSTDGGLVERVGPRSVYAVHGDLTNPADRRYRLWRRVSRTATLWRLFNALPRRRRLRLAESLERRLRSSNRDFKADFPEQAVRAYAAAWLAAGHDAVVLGHFHVERELAAGDPERHGRIFVVPEWKGSRRHLRASPEGELSFVDSEAQP